MQINAKILVIVEGYMKKVLIPLVLFILAILSFGQSEFVVSGLITLEEKGMENVKIKVIRYSEENSEENIGAKPVEIVTTSNSVGRFHFNLQPGKYRISCDYTSPVAIPEELFVSGPEEFELLDKSIEDLNFKIVNSIGYIESNKELLEDIPESIPTLNYKWGKIPVFSEEECKLKATGFLNTLKDEEGKDVLNGATLGIPLKIYDLSGNVVFYQFPIANLDTRIGHIGVHSIGLKPEESNFFNYPSISLKELNDRIIEFKNKNFLMDNLIPDLSLKLAQKLRIDQGELMFKKFLSLGPDAFSFYIVFSRFPDDEEIIIDMNDLSILSSEKTLEEIRDESEARYTLKYLLDKKSSDNQDI